MKSTDVTIIIPHLGSNPESEYALGQCTSSLEETAPDIKRIIVANGDKCKFRFYSDMWIKDQGQCKAVNAAVAATNTPWIMVTNDDMIYPPGWFEKLTEPLNTPLAFGCISPKLIEPRPGAPTFEVFFAGGAGGDFDKNKFYKFAEEHDKREHIGLRTGFNLPFLISRDIWDTVGGYDINFDPWGSNSDSDLEYKIKLAGVQPTQNPNAIVYHFSQTSGTFEPRNQEAWNKNWQYFIDKWGFPRTDAGIWEANFEIPNEGRKYRPEWENKYAV